jgi:hypothetical protein
METLQYCTGWVSYRSLIVGLMAECMTSAIDQAFSWSASPEGFEYWDSIWFRWH